MNPRVDNVSEDNNIFRFTLSNLNVSLANAIRRTLLADIPIVVFRTTPYEENKANIITNTSRLNNEILKQRLSCIPIHITELDMPLQNYIMEINVENLTDTIIYVTTEDFKIKNLTTTEYLSENDTRKIFPPGELGYYIDFARLRPKISDEIPGEKLHLTCEFGIGTAKENSMFNATSTCAYGYTPDIENIDVELGKKVQGWKDKDMSKTEIDFESKDWRLLDGQRIVKKDSFDFILQTIGIYENRNLVKMACDILINKLEKMDTTMETDELKITPSDNTMKNSYDVLLENEDYTIGKVLEYLLFSKYFEGVAILSYCGFKKLHPHDLDSIIRIAYKDETEMTIVKQNLKTCIMDAIMLYKNIQERF
jgi:DNA-directed RNA polymerase alpha subunit